MRIGRLVVAVVAGAVVALVVLATANVRAHDDETIDVVVAARDLPARAILTQADLSTVQMPRRALPTDAVLDSSVAVQRVLRDPLFQGEVVDQRHLGSQGRDTSASVLIPPDKNYAFNLPMSLFLSAPPRLQVHDRVDIIGYPRGRPVDQGVLLLRDLEVIDLSFRSADNASETTYLTLALDAQEVVRVLALRDSGMILGIALRPYGRTSGAQ